LQTVRRHILAADRNRIQAPNGFTGVEDTKPMRWKTSRLTYCRGGRDAQEMGSGRSEACGDRHQLANPEKPPLVYSWNEGQLEFMPDLGPTGSNHHLSALL
jgi:hypothetical protein